MGADGGTLAKRKDTVAGKKRDEKLDLSMVERARWFTCALSNAKLTAPIVADRVGNLFNKEDLVRALLDKRLPAAFRHVRSLRDVFAVEFHANPDAAAAAEGAPWICPVALVPVGELPFVLLCPCGHVLSERAWRELAAAAACPQCAAPCSVIRLNPPRAEQDAALAALLALQDAEAAAKRTAKKAEKRSSAAALDDAAKPDVKKGRSSAPATAAASTASTAPVSGQQAFTTESAVFKSLFAPK